MACQTVVHAPLANVRIVRMVNVRTVSAPIVRLASALAVIVRVAVVPGDLHFDQHALARTSVVWKFARDARCGLIRDAPAQNVVPTAPAVVPNDRSAGFLSEGFLSADLRSGVVRYELGSIAVADPAMDDGHHRFCGQPTAHDAELAACAQDAALNGVSPHGANRRGELRPGYAGLAAEEADSARARGRAVVAGAQLPAFRHRRHRRRSRRKIAAAEIATSVARWVAAAFGPHAYRCAANLNFAVQGAAVQSGCSDSRGALDRHVVDPGKVTATFPSDHR